MHYYTWTSYSCDLKYAAIAENVENAIQMILSHEQKNMIDVIPRLKLAGLSCSEDYIQKQFKELKEVITKNDPQDFDIPSDMEFLLIPIIEKKECYYFLRNHDELSTMIEIYIDCGYKFKLSKNLNSPRAIEWNN